MNLNGRMRKLQTAIVKTGFIVIVDSSQFYSDDQKRMITSYSVKTPVAYWSIRQQAWKTKDYEILRSCSVPDIIMCLVDIYKAVIAWK